MCPLPPSTQVLQIITVPHRPTHTSTEIDADLEPALSLLLQSQGLVAAWQGRRHEDLYTYIYLVLWQDLAASHAFFTSPRYASFHRLVQPALNGRKIHWQQHALVGQWDLSDRSHLKSVLWSPCIEIALTKVVEGGVAGYYDRFRQTVSKVLNGDPGCDGWWISPCTENPQHQILLINWKSVDVSVCMGGLISTLAFVLLSLWKKYSSF
jgi:heme-degrading monooxygenase HmoA